MADPGFAEGATLAGQIAEIPAEALGVIRNGYAVAASLPEEKRQQAIQLLVRQIERAGGSLDTDEVVNITGLSRRDASRLNAALSVAVGLLTESTGSVADFMAAAAGRLFENAQAAAVETIARQIVGQRVELQKSMDREHLAATVLPSLTGFDVAVDLRFKFANSQIEDSVAVAVVHIGTDARFQRIWLQLSRHDVGRIIEKLSDALKQMDAVEAILPRPPTER